MVCLSRFFLSVRGATRRFYCAFLTFCEMPWPRVVHSKLLVNATVKSLGQNFNLRYPRADKPKFATEPQQPCAGRCPQFCLCSRGSPVLGCVWRFPRRCDLRPPSTRDDRLARPLAASRSLGVTQTT